MICPKCGGKIGEQDKFCGVCGYKIDSAVEDPAPAGATKIAAVESVKQRTNKITLLGAVIVLILVILGVFWAGFGSKKNGDMEQRKSEISADKSDGQPDADQQSQTMERQYSSEVIQQPSEETVSGQTSIAVSSSAKAPAKSASGLDGRWDGNWRAGFNDSGQCSVTISQKRFRASCYNSQFSGRVIGDGYGVIRFEGGNHSWSCRRSITRHIDKSRITLQCSFSAKGVGAESLSGDINLYK